MSSDAINYIDIEEFVEEGYLQEANRLFFHLHGLALAVREFERSPEEIASSLLAHGWPLEATYVEALLAALRSGGWLPPEGTKVALSGVWDHRDHPEGIIFGWDLLMSPAAHAKSVAVEAEYVKHREARQALIADQLREELLKMGREDLADLMDQLAPTLPPIQPVRNPELNLGNDSSDSSGDS